MNDRMKTWNKRNGGTLISMCWFFHVAAIVFLSVDTCAAAFSLDLPSSKRFIEIFNLGCPDAVNMIPATLTENWPLWVLEPSGIFSRIPDSDGFVNPGSIDTFCQPLDLKPPTLQLAIGVHV